MRVNWLRERIVIRAHEDEKKGVWWFLTRSRQADVCSTAAWLLQRIDADFLG